MKTTRFNIDRNHLCMTLFVQYGAIGSFLASGAVRGQQGHVWCNRAAPTGLAIVGRLMSHRIFTVGALLLSMKWPYHTVGGQRPEQCLCACLVRCAFSFGASPRLRRTAFRQHKCIALGFASAVVSVHLAVAILEFQTRSNFIAA